MTGAERLAVVLEAVRAIGRMAPGSYTTISIHDTEIQIAASSLPGADTETRAIAGGEPYQVTHTTVCNVSIAIFTSPPTLHSVDGASEF